MITIFMEADIYIYSGGGGDVRMQTYANDRQSMRQQKQRSMTMLMSTKNYKFKQKLTILEEIKAERKNSH